RVARCRETRATCRWLRQSVGFCFLKTGPSQTPASCAPAVRACWRRLDHRPILQKRPVIHGALLCLDPFVCADWRSARAALILTTRETLDPHKVSGAQILDASGVVGTIGRSEIPDMFSST